ncbi:MAG: periplasmic heavy metal sensor [Alphaproteobacteria bacterium]|nr:periplasmic heavy metal sensor [Alphaproteobacteria bacterium]
MILRAILAALLAAGAAQAQHSHSHSPYAGQERRPVAALSEQEIDDLRSGAGMGMALPAELNGYPGPRHVLDLADRLGLTTAQRASAEQSFAAMRKSAMPLGEEVIAAEMALGRLFADAKATPAAVAEASDRVARLRGELRAVHLAAHIDMHALLGAEQRAAYDRLRGYGGHHKAH